MELSDDISDPTVSIPVQPLQPRVTSGGARIGIASTADGSYVSCDGWVSLDIQILAWQDDGEKQLLAPSRIHTPIA